MVAAVALKTKQLKRCSGATIVGLDIDISER